MMPFKYLILVGLTSSIIMTGCSNFNYDLSDRKVSEPKTGEMDLKNHVLQSKEWTPVRAGTASTGEILYLNGKAYQLDTKGRLLINKEDLERVESSGTEVFNPAPVAGLELSDREVQTLMADKDAFFIFLKNPTLLGPGEVSFPILKGSLESNLLRLAERMGVNSISYESDVDFYVPEDQIIVTKDINEILFTMLKGFPLEASLSGEGTNKDLRIYSVDQYQNLIAFKAQKGSLKYAAAELADLAGWDYQWEFDFDFLIPETTIIRGRNYEDIMTKLINIQNYPINASKSGAE